MENELKRKYDELANEVKEFVDEYEEIMDDSGEYKGVHILYSNLIYKPKVLFIGINPGPGYFNHNQRQKVDKYQPLELLEYIDKRYDYTLAEETKDLFEKAGCMQILETSAMKTNCCFFSTSNEPSMKILLNKIMHNGRPNIYREIESWTKRIIDMVEPEIIICEGKSAFSKVASHIIIGTPTWQNGHGYYFNNNIHVLGYERSFSNIINKEEVAKKISQLIHL